MDISRTQAGSQEAGGKWQELHTTVRDSMPAPEVTKPLYCLSGQRRLRMHSENGMEWLAGCSFVQRLKHCPVLSQAHCL